MYIYNSPLPTTYILTDRYPIKFGMLHVKMNTALQEAQVYCLSFSHKTIGLHLYYCLKDSWPPLLLPVPSLGSQKLLVLLCAAEPHIYVHMTPPSPQVWLSRQELLPVGERPSHWCLQECLSHTPFPSAHSHSYIHVGFCPSGSVKS